MVLFFVAITLKPVRETRFFVRKCWHLLYNHFIAITGAGIAQMVERPTEKPGAILTRVRVPSAARKFISQSQLLMQILLRCPYIPLVQSHASTSVRMLKICAHVKNPKHWQPCTIVWTRQNTAHTDKKW